MSKYLYEDAVKQLQESGSISLADLKNLPHDDLAELFEEIKVWCLYANGKTDKLPKEYKKKKKKKKDSEKKDWVLSSHAIFREAKHKFATSPWRTFNYQLSLVPIGNMFNNRQT